MTWYISGITSQKTILCVSVLYKMKDQISKTKEKLAIIFS